MTDEKIIERLAMFMGGRIEIMEDQIGSKRPFLVKEQTVNGRKGAFVFEPMKDWNDWRQVDEKVMEDRTLSRRYIVRLEKELGIRWKPYTINFFKIISLVDLPTRCKALVSVLDS